MTKEYQPIYVMGQTDPICIATKNEESGKTETTRGLVTTFSGSDTMWFFNKDLAGEVMASEMNTNAMTVTMCLGSTAFKVMKLADNMWIPFDVVGINENGDKGLISGLCRLIDFRLPMSIDELNTEITVYFESKITDWKGWMGVTKEENEEITYYLHKELLKTPGVE